MSSGAGAHAFALDEISARLVDDLERRTTETSRDATDAIFTEIPTYTARRDDRFYADVCHHVEQNIQAMVRSLRSGRPPTTDDLSFVQAPSRRRAQHHIGLADFLHAFRLGLRHIWRSLVIGADEDEARIAALGLVEPVSEYINRASTRVAEVYLEVQQLLTIEGEQVRRDVLHALLEGEGLRSGARSDAVAAAGLRPGAGFVVVSALLTQDHADPVTFRAASAAIGRMVTDVATPLAVQRGDEIVAVLPVGHRTGRAMATTLQDAQEKLKLQDIPMHIGASTVLSSLEHVPVGYREASSMRAMCTEDRQVLCMCGLSTFGYLTLTGDDSAVRLVAPEIVSFIEEDQAHDGVLTSTLVAYANADLSVKVMSERMFIHSNTAHKRLSRIAERTGRDLRSLTDVVELLIAIRLLGSAPPS